MASIRRTEYDRAPRESGIIPTIEQQDRTTIDSVILGRHGRTLHQWKVLEFPNVECKTKWKSQEVAILPEYHVIDTQGKRMIWRNRAPKAEHRYVGDCNWYRQSLKLIS